MVTPAVSNVLAKNRRSLLTVLLMPAVAIVVALILISAFKPSRLIVIVIAIAVVLIQYLLFVGYIWRRMTAPKNHSLFLHFDRSSKALHYEIA